MHGLKSLDSLDLDDKHTTNQIVDAVVRVEGPVTMHEGQEAFALKGNAADLKFQREGGLIRRLEQPWAECAVQRNRGTDDRR